MDTLSKTLSDYADPIYARLASNAQKNIEKDPDLSRYYFKQGMTFVCDGKPGRFFDIWKKGLENVKGTQQSSSLIEIPTPEGVFQRIHGEKSQIVPGIQLERERNWNVGYTNLDDAFIDARECIRIYYERCLAEPRITFQCGTAVRRVSTINNSAVGVILENELALYADLTVVAAGAWSNTLVFLEGLAYSSAIEIAWLEVTENEARNWKDMSITTNLSTGFNIFPPYNGEIKCLRRSPGYCNTILIPNPEYPSQNIPVSVPRTIVTNPTDVIPADAEAALRDNLRELMPSLADRPFARTKLCW
jgi:sarcosine oxidase/L-pipecolate oxidase